MALDRYLFYGNRYRNHEQALSFENQLNERINAKTEEMEKQLRVNQDDVLIGYSSLKWFNWGIGYY